MCYLVREQQGGAGERGGATQPQGPGRLRPRLVGAVAAALVGGLAVAALVGPPSTPPSLTTKDAAPAPVASRTATLPMAPVVEQTSVPIDDGVSSSSDAMKAKAGNCSHGL